MKIQKKSINKTYKLISFLIISFCFLLITNAQTPSETPPPPAEPTSLTLPEVKEMTLDNGLKVVVVQRSGLPLVSVSLLVKNGSSIEDERKAGLAELTANTLIKGTKYRTATDIAEQIDFLGGSLNTSANWNSSTVNLNVMTDKLGKALSIMSESVIRPTFPAKEIELAKKQRLDAFAVSLKEPGDLLRYVSSRYTFKEHISDGTPQTVQRIRRNDVVNFHKNLYTPSNSVLIFIGDISEKKAFGYARLFFNSWQKKIVKERNNDRTEPILQTALGTSLIGNVREQPLIKNILIVDLPKSGQAAVGYLKRFNEGRTSCFAAENKPIQCNTGDSYYPASVLNSVLGGGYSARLNQEIRLKRGLSYGARSGFDWRASDSNFSASTQTKNESAAEVADLIKIEIEKLANDSISDSELLPRKSVLTGSFGRAIQSNNALAARLRDIYLYDLDIKELNSYMDNIRKTSNTQIKEFATNNLLGGDMIIVGDASMFMDDLKKRFPNQKINVIKAKDLDLNRENLRKR